VAESQLAAEDAAELISVDYEELPAIVDPQAALAGGSPLIHERLKTNEVGWFRVQKGDAAKALEAAPHTIRRRFVHHRYAAMPMECRGVAAAYDLRTDTYTVWSSTQVVHWVRRETATTLGVSESRVRCIALDVGGGF